VERIFLKDRDHIEIDSVLTDPEIFTKAPVLSSVGCGQSVGVLARSSWNNPEPEAVLVVRSDGTAVGATLGNDVNLRDFEGRSALLLGVAKDNNASCAIGPFVRVFDESFGLGGRLRGIQRGAAVHGSEPPADHEPSRGDAGAVDAGVLAAALLRLAFVGRLACTQGDDCNF